MASSPIQCIRGFTLIVSPAPATRTTRFTPVVKRTQELKPTSAPQAISMILPAQVRNCVSYPGRDLEAMDFAENYHRWILQIFAPYLGTRMVEVGAGTGAFSALLLERRLESLALVEPSAEMYPILADRIKKLSTSAKVTTHNELLRHSADEIQKHHHPDSVLYINVLEHIHDDEAELTAVHGMLERGGRIFIFVPALRRLYGSFDKKVDHVRRYTKVELEEKCHRAGFAVLRSTYFDVFGVVPWWVKYCLLRSDKMEPGAVKAYDKFVVPLAKRLEAFARVPIGKNVLLVAEKI